jgi:cyanophycin synthetase
VTNIGEGDHLGLAEIQTVERLAFVKRTIVDAVAPTGAAVLNAADPLVAAMAPHCPGAVIFFARDPAEPVLAAHRARGGKVAYVRNEMVMLAEGDCETPVVPLSKVALTHHGRVGFQVENVLAASAAAWSLKVPVETIAEGLTSFVGDIRHTPGRFNVLHQGGATIILDYGHNSSALLALVDAISQFPHERRSVVFTAAGDRRDADIIRQGEIVGDHFDFIILYEDACRRGRPDGEVTTLIRQGLASSTRVSGTFETRGELNAVENALSGLNPGDLLVIQPDQVELCLSFVQRYLATHPPRREREAMVEKAEVALSV